MRAGAVPFVLALYGCSGKEEFVAKEHPNDPIDLSWVAGDSVGRVWVHSGNVVGETPGAPRCSIGASFVVADARGAVERGRVSGECAVYPDFASHPTLRAAGAGVVVFGLGRIERNVTIPAELDSDVELDCAADLNGVVTATMRSAAAEDADDEVPAFTGEVARAEELVIDAPVAIDFPVPLYGEGDLAVAWSMGEPGLGVEIRLEAHAADDTGAGVVRCWTSDDGEHAIPAAFVDPYREGTSVLTISRHVVVEQEVEGWTIDSMWVEMQSTSVFPY